MHARLLRQKLRAAEASARRLEKELAQQTTAAGASCRGATGERAPVACVELQADAASLADVLVGSADEEHGPGHACDKEQAMREIRENLNGTFSYPSPSARAWEAGACSRHRAACRQGARAAARRTPRVAAAS